MKFVKNPPLPFCGNKRYVLRDLAEVFRGVPAPKRVVDVFGGSGILSDFFRRLYPSSEVIYNDYDGYMDVLAQVDVVNAYREALLTAFERWGVPDGYRIPEEARPEFDGIVAHYRAALPDVPYREYLLYNWLYLHPFFPNKSLNTYYHKVRRSPYVVPEDYLARVEIVHKDWRELVGSDPETLYLLDPPYARTETVMYAASMGVLENVETIDALCGMKQWVYFTKFDTPAHAVLEWARKRGMLDGACLRFFAMRGRNELAFLSRWILEKGGDHGQKKAAGDFPEGVVCGGPKDGGGVRDGGICEVPKGVSGSSGDDDAYDEKAKGGSFPCVFAADAAGDVGGGAR